VEASLPRQGNNTGEYILGYIDYDVLLENDKGSRLYSIVVKSNSKTLLQNTFFKILSRFCELGFKVSKKC
jgi:hypothetical protein